MTSQKPYVHFVDFDQPEEFGRLEKWTLSLDSRNFVLDFNNKSALCAQDLDQYGMQQVLEQRAAKLKPNNIHPGTRWINIWVPEDQTQLIQRIGKHYGFSARLLASMCCPQIKLQTPSPAHKQERRSMGEMMDDFMFPFRSHRRVTPKQATMMARAVNASDVKISRSSSGGDSVPSLGGFELNHYRIANDVWHYSSVDWGKRYLCIGFNSLYRVDREINVNSYKPAGKRVWTWLVLCDDGTVIAIHENPFPGCKEPVMEHDRKVIRAIRRNLRNVFRQLSMGFDNAHLQNALETVKLRSGLPSRDGGKAPAMAEADAPSLLFYYLFDDWFTSYSLVARREHQYGMELDRLRDDMFERAELEHVSRLHHYGRQLAVLKRIYSSYETIIMRILDGPQPNYRQKALAMEDSDMTDRASSGALSGEADPSVGNPTTYGVSIATAASVRFRRLRDRIDMYAIGEIQDCIGEKESLMELNFNLITLKESSYIEGLTRITILLAKVTIMFIPVGFITSYFAIPFTNGADGQIEYTLAQYWVAFAVVIFGTICGLALFGRLSGTQEGKPIYQSFSKVAWKAWTKLWGWKDVEDEKGIKLRALDEG